MDNATECERAISDPEKRMIHVSVSRVRQYARIGVRNICETPVRFQDGLPVSTKGDDRYHGFCTRSAREIVDKYDGSIVFNHEDGWFEASVLLPLNSDA